MNAVKNCKKARSFYFWRYFWRYFSKPKSQNLASMRVSSLNVIPGGNYFWKNPRVLAERSGFFVVCGALVPVLIATPSRATCMGLHPSFPQEACYQYHLKPDPRRVLDCGYRNSHFSTSALDHRGGLSDHRRVGGHPGNRAFVSVGLRKLNTLVCP